MPLTNEKRVMSYRLVVGVPCVNIYWALILKDFVLEKFKMHLHILAFGIIF